MNRKKRPLLIPIIVLFAITSMLFFLYMLFDKARNNDLPPIIIAASDEIRVSVTADQAELLSGLTAMDAEDGDITDSIMIESISEFTDEGKCTITYAVFDSHNHVAVLSRTLHYTDYTPPRFQILANLEFSYTEGVNPLDYVRAVDCIEGDISNRITMTLLDANDSLGKVGTHITEFRVTNNLGDSSVIRTEIDITDISTTEQRMIPVVELSDYLIYVGQGELVEPLDYITAITLMGKKYSISEYGTKRIKVDMSHFDSTKTGLQQITVTSAATEDDEAYVGKTMLLVYVLGNDD